MSHRNVAIKLSHEEPIENAEGNLVVEYQKLEEKCDVVINKIKNRKRKKNNS